MDFGQGISIHRGTFGAGGWWWYVGIVLVLSGVLPLAQTHAASGASPIQAALEGAKILAGLLCLVGPTLRWRQTVEVFERGFVWSRVYKTLAVAREDVRAARWVHRRGRSVSYYDVEIELGAGRTCSITGVENPERLANLLNSWSANEAPPAPNGRPATANGPRDGWASGRKPPTV